MSDQPATAASLNHLTTHHYRENRVSRHTGTTRRSYGPRHVKIPGYVSEVAGRRWWAVLYTPGGDLFAEMRDRLPDDRSEGCLFTIHTTKRGRTYLHWPQGPAVTRSRVKRARIAGRALAAAVSGTLPTSGG